MRQTILCHADSFFHLVNNIPALCAHIILCWLLKFLFYFTYLASKKLEERQINNIGNNNKTESFLCINTLITKNIKCFLTKMTKRKSNSQNINCLGGKELLHPMGASLGAEKNNWIDYNVDCILLQYDWRRR